MASRFIRRFLPIVIAVMAVSVMLCSCAPDAGDRAGMEESAQAIKTTIMEKALQCYVIEGSYPSDLEYLEENYGLIVNHSDFRIMYTPVAENLPPQIKVAY